jgi:hypothetical protein
LKKRGREEGFLSLGVRMWFMDVYRESPPVAVCKPPQRIS